MSNTENIIKLNDLRNRIRQGEAVSDEELAEALLALRSARSGAAKAGAEKKKKAGAAIPLDLTKLF